MSDFKTGIEEVKKGVEEFKKGLEVGQIIKKKELVFLWRICLMN